MRIILICLLGMGCLVDAATPPSAATPGYYELRARWSARPVAEIQADAERGQADAQFYLGRLLLDGIGMPKDAARALNWLRKAEAQGQVEALAELARCHYQGLGSPQDIPAALRAARDAAARGSAAGQNILAVMHSVGAGVPRNDAEAVRLWRAAAEAGNPSAQWNLGYAHSNGLYGLTRDEAEAARWFERAAKGGHSNGMMSYGWALLFGRGVVTNRVSAFDWLQRAAALNEGHAWHLIAENGGTVAGDDSRAVLHAWRQSARLGDADAQFHLAKLIASGEVEPESPEESPARLLRAAAEADQVYAALMLADRHRWGYGGPRDLVAAARWYLHGASFVSHLGDRTAKVRIGTTSQDPGHAGGLNNWLDDRGELRPRVSPEDVALWEVMVLYRRAARQRDTQAMRELGKFYQHGLHAPVDPVEAAAWRFLARQTNPATVEEPDAASQSLSAEQLQQARDRSRQLIKRTL